MRLNKEHYAWSDEMVERSEKQKENRQIKFRVSEDRHQYLSIMAEQKGMSLAQFAKNATLGVEYRPPKIDRDSAIKIATELRKQGVNLNQIAKWCNSNPTVYKTDLQNIQTKLDEIEKGLLQLWEQL